MTATHVALLRGINVGGHNKLPMADLAKLFTDAGCTNVVTYIQSGNVVFRASAALAKRLPAAITTAIARSHDLQIPIVMRTAAELAATIAANPFVKAKVPSKQLYVAFLAVPPTLAAAATLDPKRSPPDEFRVIGSDIHLRYCSGAGTTKLTNAYFDAKLATVSTVRNWNTVVALDALVAGRPV